MSLNMNKESVSYSEYLRNNYPITDIMCGKPRNPIYGVGINDSDYKTQPYDEEGNRLKCPAYKSWINMLQRAYDIKYKEKNPTYRDVTVCNEWLIFSNFRKWWIENHVDGWQLDKDILSPHNKVYSSDTCIYVPSWLNSFILSCKGGRGKYKIGVSWDTKTENFRVHCCNQRTKKQKHVGRFKTEDEAHDAWLKRKLEIALDLKSEMDQVDLRIYPCIIRIIKITV